MIGGLKKLTSDERDLKYGAIFTLPTPADLPPEFIVIEPLRVKNQQETDFCANFASTSVSEDQEGMELDPLFQVWATRKDYAEKDKYDWGQDLRSTGLSLVKVGSLEASRAKYSITDSRTEIIDGKKYTQEDLDNAASHKKGSMLFVSGPYDLFDNMRTTLWHNQAQNESILTGVTWEGEWSWPQNKGVVDKEGTPVAGHAFKIYGWKQINGQPYLIAQLSNGTQIGDQGIFYFSREIINRDFSYGSVTFTDMPVETARYYQTNKIKADLNWLLRLYQRLLVALTNLRNGQA